MIGEREILGRFADVRRETLYLRVERGWIQPEEEAGQLRFREIDVARLEMIREFRSTFDLNEDALDLVLPLLDQVHGLRRQMKLLAEAVSREPDDVRARIGAALSEKSKPRGY